ncbi:hypothetical protein WR25_17047 [Diploscapter pachys]|uniref:Nuclear pore complex protein Nup85 n=1 Tax=Diploscapter pachys TaxID=2018661 RepID=A0A2A2LVY9_9BILA|nr:hypothetical protein WR25_17047 [Diploscapter pachys]
MHAVFQDCCKVSKTEGKLSTDAALELSRSYRSVLLATAQNSDRGRDQYIREFALWTLFEIMFLRKGDTAITIDLIEWASQCFLFVNEAVNRFAQESEDIASPSDAAFWKAVVCSLIGCRFETCANLLKQCQSDHAVRLLIEYLDKLEFLPLWLNDDLKSEKFTQWQENLRRDIRAKQFDVNPNIQFIVHMLVGEEETLGRMADQLTSEWWHMMPFYVLVKNATASFNALGPLADECIALSQTHQAKLADDQTDPFLSIFHVSDLTFLENIFANPWMSVHLVDLLLNTGSEFAAPLADLRDFLLIDYGSCLTNYSGLWEIGVEYLVECAEEGRKQADKLMQQLSIEDELMAEKIYRIATEYCLKDTIKCLVKSMSDKHIGSKEWASALGWALRTDESKLIDSIVLKIIWAATDKEISMFEIFDQLEVFSIKLFSFIQFSSVSGCNLLLSLPAFPLQLLLLSQISPQRRC